MWEPKTLKIAAVLFMLQALITLEAAGADGSSGIPMQEIDAREIMAKIQRGQPVEYDHVIVKGDLDLGQEGQWTNITSPIRINDSIFNGPVSFNYTTLEETVDLSGSNFTGNAFFHVSLFRGGADFRRATFSDYSNFEWTMFSSYSDFDSTTFNGRADFEGTRFSGTANFGIATFRGPVDFGTATFSEYAKFIRATFGGYAGFGGATFGGYAEFAFAKFGGDAEFRLAKFAGFPGFTSADFGSTTFGGDTDFESAIFGGDSLFRFAAFRGSVNFRRAVLRGYASFGGAKFDGYADFDGVNLSRGAEFIGVAFGESADFGSATFAGNSSFEEAEFNGNIEFGDTRFENETSFYRVLFKRPAYFENCSIKSLNLTKADFGRLHLRWDDITSLHFDEAAYLALIKNYNTLGWYGDANRCYYDYRNAVRRNWRTASSTGFEASILKLFDLFIDYMEWILYGYGVRPIIPISWSAIIILVFGLFFRQKRCLRKIITEERIEDSKDASDEVVVKTIARRAEINALDPILFSLFTFTSGFTAFLHPSVEYKLERCLRWAIAERLLGPFFLALVIATISKTYLIR